MHQQLTSLMYTSAGNLGVDSFGSHSGDLLLFSIQTSDQTASYQVLGTLKPLYGMTSCNLARTFGSCQLLLINLRSGLWCSKSQLHHYKFGNFHLMAVQDGLLPTFGDLQISGCHLQLFTLHGVFLQQFWFVTLFT